MCKHSRFDGKIERVAVGFGELILWALSENMEVGGLTVKGIKNKLENFRKREGWPLLTKEIVRAKKGTGSKTGLNVSAQQTIYQRLMERME